MEYRHKLKIQTRWTDFDMLGHVNNNAYLQYFDLAKSDYFLRRLGGEFDARGNALVIVSLQCDYAEPTFPKEPVEVQTCVLKLGEKSLKLAQQIVNTDTGNVKCICHTVMVAFDVKTQTAIEIPDSWRKLISDFEGGL